MRENIITCEMCGDSLIVYKILTVFGQVITKYDVVGIKDYFPEDGDYYEDDYNFDAINKERYDAVVDAYEELYGERSRPVWCGCYACDWRKLNQALKKLKNIKEILHPEL